MKKLAIISSHPIQYYAPWFRYLAQRTDLSLKVFYLWDFGITQKTDQGFQQAIQWDIPLLSGYEYEFVPNISSKPGTNHFWGLQNPSLIQQIRHYQPDAVLMMNYNYVSLYQFIAQWKDTPLLFRGDSHRLFPETGIKSHLRRKWISFIYQKFSACLYVGHANHEYFRYHHVPADRLFFSPHAIDNDRFLNHSDAAIAQAQTWKQELGIPDHHKVILFAGKFISKKRPFDLLQAFLNARLINVSLLFVGAGELESSLREQAKSHPHIYFAPFQNQSQMPRTYAIADLFVLPSYGSGETWGLAVNEAMCMAKPIIVSDHVGCAANLVKSGENGLIVPAGNIEALSDALMQSFSNATQLQHWGDRSREYVSHYSYHHTTQGLIRALDAVCS